MLDMIMDFSSIIMNIVVINAVSGLVVSVLLVVLLSVLLVLVLMVSVDSIILIVKNSILSKVMIRNKCKPVLSTGFHAFGYLGTAS
ncbi:MAG: hypothetical protein ACM3ZR_12980 [Pseudomonadota bacterium]